jgi:5-methyltetrahydrofolate--homocysteine methyltransferase
VARFARYNEITRPFARHTYMTQAADRRKALFDTLRHRIIVLDGGMGTMLFAAKLTPADYGGPVHDGCHEYLAITRPDVLKSIHRAYYEAGSDIVETNTFQSSAIVLAEYGLADRSYEISRAAAALAREVANEISTPARPRWVAGAMGPTTKTISVTGGVTFEQLRESYYTQAKGLVDGGADVLLLETCNDTRTVKAALVGIRKLFDEIGENIPLMISGTIEPMGTMLAGQTADAFWVSIAHAPLISVGLNCATGPEFMTDHLRTLHELAPVNISCYPNAGLPNPDGSYNETATTLAEHIERFVNHGWLNMVGGCCGTTPEHIRALAQMVEGRAPRSVRTPARRSYYSGIELVEADDSNRPLIVGERTNVIGSRLFKNMIAEEKWEEATDIAKRQVRNGAHIVDVCLQSSDRDEARDAPRFYDLLIRKIKTPIMIDTTDPAAVELALTYCQGKSIINSINLEDGEEKFERICPLARTYGAALVVGCIDEDPVQAQAFTRDRKLAIAARSYQLLTEKYGIPAEDIVFDPLVFPCATGDENYVGGAVETIEGLRLIKERIPFAKTVLGISNISFGLPATAREVVNSVFLYYCTKAGLDLAIVNAEKLERFASIPAEERKLAEDLLFNGAMDSDWRAQSREEKIEANQRYIAAIAEHFRGAVKEKKKASELPLDERLANYIIEGSKDGLIDDLNRKLAEGLAPLDIVNGPLMAGMTEVGRLFNANELIVAEVLQSAEAMKAAVNHLQQFMEKADTATRGRIVLATVKGDVHDIGKNLVEIILSNNGYEVINLGIKVPPEKLIEAWQQHNPDAIGLSGLLVKSAQQMVYTAADFHEAGIHVPLLVGGAALSEKFTQWKIGPAYQSPTFYAKDAMTGLRLLNEIMDPEIREQVLARHVFREEPETGSAPAPAPALVESRRSRKVRTDIPIPAAPYLDRKARLIANLAEVWNHVNPQMLYGRHLGFKGQFEKKLAERDPQALALYHDFEQVKKEATRFIRPRAVWQFFEAERDGNAIHLFAPGGKTPLHTFRFGRQPREDGLCLSDYVLDPVGVRRDHLALFVVTAGEGVREAAEAAKQAGEYFKAHGYQALALETAEGAAEWLHRRLRDEWGFPDPENMTMQERFTSRYRGKRYSFGYPACPNLEDQESLFKLLQPEEIGVHLTDGFMMDPEASVSALVFHHPDCAYFTASEAEAVPA